MLMFGGSDFTRSRSVVSNYFNKMDFDLNLFLNFIPIISITTITFVTCATAFYKIRKRWPVKVNCWFCNGNVKVQRQSLDWWFCPHCEQYNGFSENGDYNYKIPEQHRGKRNLDYSYCERKNFQKSQNILCEKCNVKEELKLFRLRELENSSDEISDKKLKKFQLSSEKKFPLCFKCQSMVRNVLHQQMLWMTQYKMLLFKQKPIKRILENREWFEKVMRILLSVLASVAIYYTDAWYLPLCGILLQLIACIACPLGNRKSDIFPILGWICLVLVRAFSTTAILEMFKVHYNWDSDNDDTYQYFIISLGTAVGLANLRFKSTKTLSNGSLTFKKLESPALKNTTSRSSSQEVSPILDDDSLDNQDKPRNFHSPVNITDTLLTPTAVETPIPLRPASFAQWSNQEKKISPSTSPSSRTSIFGGEVVHQPGKTLKSQNVSLSYSLTSLNSLSLGSQAKSLSPNSQKVFETKVYSTTSPDIFNKQHRFNQKRSILAPPRLNSVSHNSWIAGGCWQSGIDMPTLSRSSSQSSGIGSSGSNYGHSREPSVHEFDQFSVASERCYFTRPESPLSTHNSTVTRARRKNCSPRCSRMSDSDCSTLQCHGINDSKCSGHATLVTSPLLSVLLCGSLILNMVVLCTILLR